MNEIKAVAALRGVTAEVCPGGALTSLNLTRAAMSQGAESLAETVVEAIAQATAQANQRTRSALKDTLATVDASALGLSQSETLTELAESTVPETWRLR